MTQQQIIMETSLWEMTLCDKRVFRIFCANKTQETKILKKFNELNDKWLVSSMEEISNGIHTTKQFLDFTKFSRHYESNTNSNRCCDMKRKIN